VVLQGGTTEDRKVGETPQSSYVGVDCGQGPFPEKGWATANASDAHHGTVHVHVLAGDVGVDRETLFADTSLSYTFQLVPKAGTVITPGALVPIDIEAAAWNTYSGENFLGYATFALSANGSQVIYAHARVVRNIGGGRRHGG